MPTLPGLPDPPPVWALEYCVGCALYWPLAIHEVACHSRRQHPRSLFALAWLCPQCDRVIDSIGIYSDRAAALNAGRRTLRQRWFEGTTRWRGTASDF